MGSHSSLIHTELKLEWMMEYTCILYKLHGD